MTTCIRSSTAYSGPSEYDLGAGNFVSAADSLLDETKALIARMTVAPTNTEKARINRRMRALLAAGVFAKLDFLYVFDAHDFQAAKLNWAGANEATQTTPAPTFTAFGGVAGNGTTSFINPGFNPNTAPTPKFTRDSAHIGLCLATDLPNGASAAYEIGLQANSYISRSGLAAGQAGMRVNAAQSGIVFNGVFPGHVIWSRPDSGNYVAYGPGGEIGGGAVASAALSNTAFRICSGDAKFGVNTIKCAHVGAHLTEAEATALIAALAA